jgi:hypothetical protein
LGGVFEQRLNFHSRLTYSGSLRYGWTFDYDEAPRGRDDGSIIYRPVIRRGHLSRLRRPGRRQHHWRRGRRHQRDPRLHRRGGDRLIAYDELGPATTEADPAGNLVKASFDADNNRTSMLDSRGRPPRTSTTPTAT